MVIVPLAPGILRMLKPWCVAAMNLAKAG
jgi:hypothetical protein